MNSKVTDIKVTKSITLRTKSPYGWFFSVNGSIKMLYNNIHRELSVVIPDADCHLTFKVKSKAFLPSEKVLQSEYANFCVKHRIKNIFNN